ncbi:meiotic recombination protein SPO11-like isoform X2 [Haliotis rubra]|uniref:meiotic recombination protein SPO11-like isoform X2 n=1 Tax=Haliotis rubra TaxID=36100 RepID=UPI001EE5C515|nr:meiotic recombination protein SPO11-like isoform X2 [Haliotis rubra]
MNNSADFWHSVDFLSRQLCVEWQQSKRRETPKDAQCGQSGLFVSQRHDVLKKIEKVILKMTQSISEGDAPVFSYPNKSSWDSVRFENGIGIEPARDQKLSHVRFDSLQSVKKFGLMTRILSIIYNLIQQNKYCTKRDLYYQFPELLGSQTTLDNLVDNVACLLETPRWDLHVLATCKGSVAGDLQFYSDQGHFVDCSVSQTGVPVPAHMKDMQNMTTGARFVLIVEKDATFQRLLGDQFCHKFRPCIMVTGKGFPDLGTRLLLRALWDRFQLPMFILVDADPHGIEIMCVYKFGSKAQAAENRFLVVPNMKWLGILPTDLDGLNIHESVFIPFTKKDMDKASELIGRPYVLANPPIATQARISSLGFKFEHIYPDKLPIETLVKYMSLGHEVLGVVHFVLATTSCVVTNRSL